MCLCRSFAQHEGIKHLKCVAYPCFPLDFVLSRDIPWCEVFFFYLHITHSMYYMHVGVGVCGCVFVGVCLWRRTENSRRFQNTEPSLLTFVLNFTKTMMHSATRQSVTAAPTRAPSRGVSCTSTAFDGAAGRVGGTGERKRTHENDVKLEHNL